MSVVAVANQVWLYVFVDVDGPDQSDRLLTELLKAILRRRSSCEWHRLDATGGGLFFGIRLQDLKTEWGHFYGDPSDLHATAQELASCDAVSFMDRMLFNRFASRCPESFGQRGVSPLPKNARRFHRSPVW
jgi:hypothetical protein